MEMTMKHQFTFLLAVVFCSTNLIAPSMNLAQQISSQPQESPSAQYAMKAPTARPAEEAAESQPLPQKDSWDKQWLKEEFDQGVARFVFKDMIGEKGYEHLILSDPPRIVLDLQDPKHPPPSRWYQLSLEGQAFHKMRVGTYPDKVRFVLDLSPGEFPQPSVHAEGADLIVLIGPFSDPSQTAEVLAPAAKAPAADPVVAHPQPQEDLWDKQWLREDYRLGFTRIVVEDMIGDRGYNYEMLTDPARLVVDLRDPKHPPPSDSYEIALEGTAFSRMQVEKLLDTVRLVLDLRHEGLSDPIVYPDGTDLIILARASSSPSSKSSAEKAAAPPVAPLPAETPEETNEDEGGRTAEEIREVVASHMGGLRYLYNNELKTNPSLHGKVTVMFEIAPEGKVIQTVVISSSLESKALEGAILENIQKWKFSQTDQENGNVKVTYPFVFMSPSI